MFADHEVGFRTRNADERMAECIRNGEPNRRHGLLERGVIDALRIMQCAVHVEDHGAQVSRQGRGAILREGPVDRPGDENDQAR